MGSNNNMKNSGGPQGGGFWGNMVRQNQPGQSPQQQEPTGIGPSNPPEAGMPDTSQDAQMPQTPIEGGMNRGPQMPRTVSNEEMQQMFQPKQGQGEYWTNKLGQGGVVGGQEQQNQNPMGISPNILQKLFQQMNAGRGMDRQIGTIGGPSNPMMGNSQSRSYGFNSPGQNLSSFSSALSGLNKGNSYRGSGNTNYQGTSSNNYRSTGNTGYQGSGNMNYNNPGNMNYQGTSNTNYRNPGNVNYRGTGSINYR